VMDDNLYKEIADFLLFGRLPATFPSNKYNFIATAQKYTIDANGYLHRQTKKCLLASEIELVFQSLHSSKFYY
jgi:hypothetical protein